MEFRDRQIVVTGGTGALGTAVVAALVERGATCHVPYIIDGEAERFAFRSHERVRLAGGIDLADEDAVARLYGSVPSLWASIHIAGGFAMASIADTGKAGLMAQLETNLVSCYLCCAASVRGMRASAT